MSALIKLVTNASEVDPKISCDILVNSFIGEYSKYLQPQEISPELTSWCDGNHSVKDYYERYFTAEFEKLKQQKIPFWVCAYLGDQLVGWATFEREGHNAVYMDLLVVDPTQQGKGIGTQLVKSLISLNAMPELTAIYLLLRTKNLAAKKFYMEKHNFIVDESFKREDNFVDRDLLIPLIWKNAELLSA